MERADRNRRAAVALGLLLACCRCASALNPSLDINQYAHNAWTVRDGFFKGAITAIAQTPDGYLWLGTEFGLFRFDGVRSVPWDAPAGDHLPGNFIDSLLAARDGRLWIGATEGLASWKDGKLTHYPELAGQSISALVEDREGTVWGGGYKVPSAKLCGFRDGRAQCYGEDGSFGREVAALYEDSRGNLWAGGLASLWRWKPGPPKLFPMPDPALTVHALLEGDNGALLIALRSSMRQLIGGKPEPYRLPGAKRQFAPYSLLRDRDGGMWIGTSGQGLWHVHHGRTDRFTQADGLSGDQVTSLFEDREGNIWAATVDGLDRFRDFAVPGISVKQGLSSAALGAVLASGDGSIWIATTDGLNRWNDGQVTIYRKQSSGLPDDYIESLFQDDRGRILVSTLRGAARFENGRFIPVNGVPGRYVWSIAGDRAGNVWMSHDQGLFHLREGSLVERIPWARLGRNDSAWGLLFDPLQGGLWIGFSQGGVLYFQDGRVRASYTARDGLGEGRVTRLHLDGDGTLWAATQGGLSRVKNGRVTTLTRGNGLPCDTVHWAMEDDAKSLWLYMACGLVRIPRTELDAWASGSRRTVQVTVLDASDGVRLHSFVFGQVSKSRDGRLWFPSGSAISFVDPLHLPVNKLPPPIHIEGVKADSKTYDLSRGVRLPARVRDVSIEYTALSFVAPEKVRFRVMLEGHDRDWQDVGNRRQMFYNDLPPRHYRFRVMASNNSGVWNETGDSLDFSIEPAYYQTRWFLALCVAAFLAMLWALYRYRLYQIAREFNANLEGRVDERLRVARELHDTLLQSFQGLLLQFQGARNLFPKRPEQALKTLEGAIDLASDAIREGREAIQKLRSSTVVTNELAKAVEAVGTELAEKQQAANGDKTAFSVEVEGASQELHPILRDEVFRITAEALRNAFRHARARRIEVEIRYDARELRVRVRDDGAGMDASMLQEGRTGHYGLPGMRERAKSIGGQLDVWSEQGAGTEVELTVPGSAAYGSHVGRRFRLFKSRTGTNS